MRLLCEWEVNVRLSSPISRRAEVDHPWAQEFLEAGMLELTVGDRKSVV